MERGMGGRSIVDARRFTFKLAAASKYHCAGTVVRPVPEGLVVEKCSGAKLCHHTELALVLTTRSQIKQKML